MFTRHVFRVIAVARMGHGARTLDGLPTTSGGAQRIISLMVVIGAERFAIVDIERFIRKRFLE